MVSHGSRGTAESILKGDNIMVKDDSKEIKDTIRKVDRFADRLEALPEDTCNLLVTHFNGMIDGMKFIKSLEGANHGV
jgi:hypothetical protein